MIIDHTFEVNRSIVEAFDYFANIENVPAWADRIKLTINHLTTP